MLVELDDLDETLSLFEALRADPIVGVSEIVPAARTLLMRCAVGVTADGQLAQQVLVRGHSVDRTARASTGDLVELPMEYDGEDLPAVAEFMGLSEAAVTEAHQSAIWQVAFCGFSPGFAYMTCQDTRFELPRRASPRTRIPEGAVALASRFCGVYPRDTPGGWQIIGTTKVPMWDLARPNAALLRPGMRCRFVRQAGRVYASVCVPPTRPEKGLRVVSTAFPILFQDEGRSGQAGQGVSASGALDLEALRRANRAVGNPAYTAALEITLGPVRLHADEPMVLALTGAGRARVMGEIVDVGAAFALDAGDEVHIDPPSAGVCSYLALRGGYDVTTVLGSASTDTLARIGPSPLLTGDVVALGHHPAAAVAEPEIQPELPKTCDIVELPVILGPRTDWFSPDMIDLFLSQEWLVTSLSSRVGLRLEGTSPILRADAGELPSEGTEVGAIQIPHSGQPVLFLADHPLTGGYPVIATLTADSLSLAGQIPPGARVRFTADHTFAPILPELT